MNLKKKAIIGLIILMCLGVFIPFVINFVVISKSDYKILNYEDAVKLEDVDAIIVLGCKVNGNEPSMMLKFRLDKGIELYKDMNTKLLLSGDHGQKEYDEVNAMRDYVLEKEIDTHNVFLDHAGFSTYDSMYRAKEVFGIKKVIVVTQRYHLYRSLYIANELGIEAYGVSADDIPYPMINKKNEIREFLARNKDFVKVMFKPSSKYVGEPIDIKGDGNITLE